MSGVIGKIDKLNRKTSEEKKQESYQDHCIKEQTPKRQDDSFTDSAIVGAVTNSGFLGGILGGDIVGGMLGDLFNGGKLDD